MTRERRRRVPQAGPSGLLTPLLDRVGRRLVRVGALVMVLGVVIVGPTGFLLIEDVQSVPVFVAVLVVLLVAALVVARHDWSTAIAEGRAHRHAEVWAGVVLVSTTVNVVLSIPRSGSWLYFLVIAGYFAILLPRGPALGVLVASLMGLVLGEWAAGTGLPQILTAALGVTMVAIVGHGVAEMVARVVTESENRARMLATVALSARAVASLDPDEVPRRVADAAMQLGFDLVAITQIRGGQHRPVVEHSLLGPVFDDAPIPTGPMIRAAVEGRRTIVRNHYLQGESPNPQLRARGVDAVVVSPVVVEGEVRVVLIGGRTASDLDPAQTEAFTLLGELLAQSLVNARRFEREREAVATLDELGALKDDFISNVSHELRTPITVILGGLQTLDRRGEQLPDDVRGRLFRTALSNAEVLQGTLEALLEFARVEQGRAADEGDHLVDLADVVHSSVERLDSLLVDHDVHVDAPQPAVARVAINQLDRVVDNLLLNACRHTPSGTRIDLVVRVQDGRPRVEVADRGPGIASEDLPHLTDRFFRGGESTTRSTRGLGLGLALVQSILVAHDSELRVESSPGVGSRFWFELPAHPDT